MRLRIGVITVLTLIALACRSGDNASVTLNSITVMPSNPNLARGATQQFIATGNYSDSSSQELTSSVIWTSSNPSVATIDGAGLASTVSAGTATITATAGNISGSTALTVSVVLDFSGSMSRVETRALDQSVRHTTQPDILKVRNPAVDEQRRRIYFSGTLSPNLGVIDKTTNQIVDSIDVGVHGYLSKHLAVNSATGIIYFTTLEDQRLYRADPVSKSVPTAISLGGGGGLVVDDVNDRVFAVGLNEVRIYDGMLNLQSRLTATGANDIRLSGARLYVIQSGNSVNVYDVSNVSNITLLRSLALPAGVRGRFLAVADGSVYVGCDPKTVVVMTDASPTQTRSFTVSESTAGIAVAEGSLFVLTGYPYLPGYLPQDNGSFGFVEIYDATTLNHLRTIKTGLEGAGMTVSGTGSEARMYIANTGDSTLAVYNISGDLLSAVDTGTSIENLVVRPSDGAVIAANRIGGSTLVVVSGNSSTEVPAGNWPTKILTDEQQGVLYALSHFESSVWAFDLATLTHINTYKLGVQPLRTDALATMAIDATNRRIYVALPELGQVAALDLATGVAGTAVSIAGLNASQVHSPGALHVAANGKLGLVYVLSTLQKMIFVYDSALSPVSQLDLSATGYTDPPLDGVVVDEVAGKVYVGTLILDAQATTVSGQLPVSGKVIGISAPVDRLYVSSGAGSITEIERSSLTVKRHFDLLPIEGIASVFAFDFNRGLAYVGYFDGRLDVIRFATVQ